MKYLAANFIGTDSDYVKVPSFFTKGLASTAGDASLGTLITSVINVGLLVVGSIAVVFLMVGGYRYVMSSGNEEAAEGAKKTITHAIIGLVIVIMSFVIVNVIARILVGGGVF